MSMQYAFAEATKTFFLDMFTRDISLEDSILDLIDNSIDSLIRWKGIDVSEEILGNVSNKTSKSSNLPQIDIHLNNEKFEILDNCGGISREDAINEVFMFGHKNPIPGSQLGVYGIGLKRAIFKIGNNVEIVSKTMDSGFKSYFEIDKWVKDEKNWTIPINFTGEASSVDKAGTKITIEFLRPEIKLRIKSGIVENLLTNAISNTYALFLENFVRVTLNGNKIDPATIPLGESPEVKSAKQTLTEEKVRTTIITSLTSPSRSGSWSSVNAGWYILCNGRVVLSADKSSVTGWGLGMPAYHSKYSRFIGIVFFYSKNPHHLPWTTTKRDLNKESIEFQKARISMIALAKPVTSFLNDLYPSDLPEEPRQRIIANNVKATNVIEVAQRAKNSTFSVKEEKKPKERNTVNVQYRVSKLDLERIRKHLKRTKMSASDVGMYTFNYFLKTECPEL